MLVLRVVPLPQLAIDQQPPVADEELLRRLHLIGALFQGAVFQHAEAEGDLLGGVVEETQGLDDEFLGFRVEDRGADSD